MEQKRSYSDLVNSLQLANVSTMSVKADRSSSLEVLGASVTSNAASMVTSTGISYKIDYRVLLRSTEVDSPESQVATLESSVVVDFFRPDESIVLNQADCDVFAPMALIAGHPYLRQNLSFLANTLGLPSLTLGLLRLGNPNPESISIGNKLFNLGNNVVEESLEK